MTFEEAKQKLSRVKWKTDDRDFTEDEKRAIFWATFACHFGEISPEQFSELLGGIPVELLTAAICKS